MFRHYSIAMEASKSVLVGMLTMILHSTGYKKWEDTLNQTAF